MNQEMIILVDKNDKQIGSEEKIKAHEDGGKLHRAFSIFLFNSRGEMLLQLRARKKYHFGGLWTNTCCGHPRDGEELDSAARRRLKEESGINTNIKEVFSFIYQADAGNGLTEHEFDHVFVGKYEDQPVGNPEEADDWKWMSIDDVRKDLQEHPENYTPWFKIAFDKVASHQS